MLVLSSLQVYCHFFFSSQCGGTSESGWLSYISGSSAVGSLFFSVGGSWLVHNVLTLIFRILLEDLAASLTTSSTMVCLLASLTFPLPPSSCYFRPWYPMNLLCFGCTRYLFLNICPLWVPRTTLSLAHLFRGFQYPTTGCWFPDRSCSALLWPLFLLDLCPNQWSSFLLCES
jgi:hypothetical protein